MGKRLHSARTERRSAVAPVAPPLASELLKYVATDISSAKTRLEPRLFSAALHLIQNPPTPVALPPSRASARHWQGIVDASAQRQALARLELLPSATLNSATLNSATRASPDSSTADSGFQLPSPQAQQAARSQHWQTQIQRFGVASYAKHYADQSDFQTHSANLESSGEALHPVLLQALEAHFQQRLPAIRIHSDASAASRAKEVGALAFTSGSGIHFGAGQYQPFSSEGFKLLVHETAHVMQQAQGIVPEGIDTDPSLERAAQLEASRVVSAPSLNAPAQSPVSSQPVSSQPFETAGQWAAHLLNTLKHHAVPRERFAVVAEIYSSIPIDQQGKARALMLGKLNPDSSDHQRLESALVVMPSVKSGISSASQGKPRQPGEMNFFTYLNPLERDLVLPNYKAFPVSSDTVKNAQLETVAPIPLRSARSSARALRQPFRATHATTRAIQRQRAEETKLKTVAEISTVGLVFNPSGVNLYAKPNTSGKDKPSGRLAFNTKALVVRELEGGWYQVSALGGGTGYVNKKFIRVYKDDPGANLHQVKSGQSALGVAEQYYQRFVQPGMDLRYFVNVLAHANPNALKKPSSSNWRDVAFNASTVIRVPGIQAALNLRSKVDDGSLTNGMYAKVTGSLGRIGDLTKSVLESPQFIGEVLGDLWEVIKPQLPQFIAITAALIAAELTVAALAAIPEPTLITKVVAMLLQGAILLFVGYGAAVSLYSAINEGATWIKTAWNANGKYAQVKLASKAFLRMLGSVALAVLAIMGVRGSLGRFTKLYAKYKTKLPAVKSDPTIASPLKGNPKAIWRGYASLSRIQQQVLELLPSKGSQTVIPKGAFKLKDLAALTASTGDEFAMFTLAGRRLIMRGTREGVPINQEMAAALAKKGWRWSAHTHPDGTLRSSPGDRIILNEFGVKKSAILIPELKWILFNPQGDMLNSSWLP